MKRCRFRRCWVIPACLLLTPLLMWLLIVLVAPTNWARGRLEQSIAAVSGRPARLQGLSVCLLGGVRLTNLEIGTPTGIEDPWLRAPEVTLDLSPLSIFRGALNPSFLEINDATLRILRRKDGMLEIADLMQPTGNSSKGSPSSTDGSDCCALGRCLTGAHRLKVGIHRALVVIVDEVNGANIELSEVEGEAMLEGRTEGVVNLHGFLDGGSIQIAAHFDKSLREPTFNLEIEAAEVPLTQSLAGIRYLMPVLTGQTSRLEGQMNGRIFLQSRGSDLATLQRSLRGRGDVSLAPVRLEGTALLEAISELAEVPRTNLADSIRSQFKIQDERISTDLMTIQFGSIPIKLTGWTDFNGSLEYRMNLNSTTGKLSDRARRFLREIDPDLESMTSLQLSGNLDRPVLQLAGDHLPLGSGSDADRRREERLRQMGRRLLDKLVR